MRYEESIIINDINYYFIFTDEVSTTSFPDMASIFFAKESVGNMCDNWSMDTDQDILMQLCQLSVDWINLNYPDSFYFLSTNIDVYDLYKSYESKLTVRYNINEKEIKIWPGNIYMTTYTKSVS